jgi:hypothetical protein
MELSGMMRQFKIERSEPRLDVALRVHLTATDMSGETWEEEIMTTNVSRKGALLKGVHGDLRLGSQVTLKRLQKQEQFLIAWVGEKHTPRAGQIGVSAVNTGSSFWNDVLDVTPQAGTVGAGAVYSRTMPAKSKATVFGA